MQNVSSSPSSNVYEFPLIISSEPSQPSSASSSNVNKSSFEIHGNGYSHDPSSIFAFVLKFKADGSVHPYVNSSALEQ